MAPRLYSARSERGRPKRAGRIDAPIEAAISEMVQKRRFAALLFQKSFCGVGLKFSGTVGAAIE